MINDVMGKVDLSRSAISRYIQLATLFRRRIETGEWPVGSQIPTVEELANECGVARATIRQALDELARERLIERYRAKGTFVIGGARESLWCTVRTDWSGLLRPSSEDARIEVLHARPKPIPLPIAHEIGTAAPLYRHVQRRHWRKEAPFLLTDLYIAEPLGRLLTKKELGSKTALKMISDMPDVEIGDAMHTMIIGSADPVAAELLHVPVNAPVAHVQREVVDSKGVLILVSAGVYRGDVVRFEVKLR